MNKILLICDEKEIILNTMESVCEIAACIEYNMQRELMVIEDAQRQIAIVPSKITLIEDITKKSNLNSQKDLKCNITFDGEKLAECMANTIREEIDSMQVLGN